VMVGNYLEQKAHSGSYKLVMYANGKMRRVIYMQRNQTRCVTKKCGS
jgi:hypothetical protein